MKWMGSVSSASFFRHSRPCLRNWKEKSKEHQITRAAVFRICLTRMRPRRHNSCHRPQPDSPADYLNYLASWIALPLRAEKPAGFNRAFFQAAIPLYPQRSTLVGLEKLLRAWLKRDLLENSPTDPPLLIVTDLTRTYNDVDAIFQLAPEVASRRVPGEIYAQLGVNTVGLA